MKSDNFKNPYNEKLIEDTSIQLFIDEGYQHIAGEEINNIGNDSCLREDYATAFYLPILKESLYKINPETASNMIEEAIKDLTTNKHSDLIQENKRLFKLLTTGVKVRNNKTGMTETVKVIDFDSPQKNSFIVSNQLILKEGNRHRKPDVLVFVNGLPLCMIEFKNAYSQNATMLNAYNQLETYKNEFPQAFYSNQINIISDGFEARVGSLSSGYDRFSPWRNEEKTRLENLDFQMGDVIKDLFKPEKFLRYIKNFITFINSKGQDVKICAGYHQMRCVESSLISIKTAMTSDKRGGIVWHSTGSGKSFSMMFLAAQIEKDPNFNNPTIVVITDRIALDSQLYRTFCNGKMVLGKDPEKIESSVELKEKLKGIKAGGVYFSTLQKFGIDKKEKNEIIYETLSDRHNIVIMVDEAHRSHSGIEDGSARYLRDAFPNATFIGFTGTPIAKENNDTRAIFGEDNDIYDMAQSTLDGATVKIRYEARMAQVKLNEKKAEELNALFEQIESKTDLTYSEQIKRRNAKMNAILGSPERLGLLATDITEHFKLRKEALPFSKAMIICSSRQIAVKLYKALIKQNPSWHSDDINKGKLKVIVSSTSATDSSDILKHKTTSAQKETVAKRLREEKDELNFVIVCDMWLTGFDAPPINTMYFDKLMREHALIQAIARANRVYKEKPDGLIVDYIGLLGFLKEALSIYSPKDRETVGEDIREKSVNIMMAKYSNICDLLYGFEYKESLKNAHSQNDGKILLELQKEAFKFIVGSPDSDMQKQFIKWTNDLQKAYSLCATTKEAESIRKELVFFCSVKELILKNTNIRREGQLKLEDINTQIGNLASQAVEGVKIVDLMDLANIEKNQIDIFSQDFLEEVRKLKSKNLALEMLKKLISDDIRERSKKSVVESQKFSEMLNQLINNYHNGQFDSAQMLEEMIKLSKRMMAYDEEKRKLDLSPDEIAFYSALADNKSAKEIMGDEKLKELTKALLSECQRDVNFNFLDNKRVQAQLRLKIKKLLKKYGYPPDMSKLATDNVVKQSMLIAKNNF